eukprot:161581_1
MTSPSSAHASPTRCITMKNNYPNANSPHTPHSVIRSPSHNTLLNSPSTPSIPSIPYIPTLQPVQINGVQYTNGAVPVIVVPNMNLMNTSNNKTTAASTMAPPNDKIKQILEKKRKGKEPLNDEEMKILESAVQSARQQFLLWYQQQALRQQLLLNNANVMSNPNATITMQPQAQTPMAQALSPKQIALLQQRQLLQQQQQIIQAQLALQMANNQWNNNVNLPRNAIANNPYHVPRNSNPHNVNELFTYFGLPRPEEFDKIFYNESKQDDDDDEDVMSMFGVHDDDDDTQQEEEEEMLSFDIELEGLGTFQFGKQCRHKSLVHPTHHHHRKTEPSKENRKRMYELLGVKDITDDCCQWLIRDLMRSQSELKSDSGTDLQERNVVMTQLKHVTTDVISKQQMDQIVKQITRNPSIPHSVVYSKIYDVYCSKNSLIEISHVDISSAHIEVNVKNKPETRRDTCQISMVYDKDKLLNELEVVTLDFFNLCILMQQHFDPSKDVETLPIQHLARDDIVYKTALKLRDNPHYFTIPTVHPSKPPIDRQLFGTKINIKKANNTLNNVNISNAYPSYVPVAYTNPNISMARYNPLPVMNPFTTPSLVASPIMYNNNNTISNPYMAPQNARLPVVNMPTTYHTPQVHLLQSPPTPKWNGSAAK